LSGDVGHVEAGHEEGGGEGEGADVFFYFGFAVEVVDVGELAVGYCVVGRIGVSYCLIVPLNFIESIFGGWDMGLKRGGEERRGKSRQ